MSFENTEEKTQAATPDYEQPEEDVFEEDAVDAQDAPEAREDGKTDFLSKAREAYANHMPVNWDMAYTYFTSNGAPAIMDEKDRTRIVNILNHGKFNRKILRLSMILFVISVIGIVFTGRISLFYIRPIFKIILPAAEVLLIAYGVLTYRKDRFSSLQWLMPGICAVWLVYLFLWLV